MSADQSAERALWCAVISQALEDAVSNPNSHLSPREIAEARAWLTKPSKDFDKACNLAGFEPAQVREKAKSLISEADEHRNNGTSASDVVYAGKRWNISELAAHCGLETRVLRRRLKEGWAVEEAVNTSLEKPAKKRTATPCQRVATTMRSTPNRGDAKKHTYGGLSLSNTEWARRLGISPQAMHHRLKTMPADMAFAPPTPGRRKRWNMAPEAINQH